MEPPSAFYTSTAHNPPNSPPRFNRPKSTHPASISIFLHRRVTYKLQNCIAVCQSPSGSAALRSTPLVSCRPASVCHTVNPVVYSALPFSILPLIFSRTSSPIIQQKKTQHKVYSGLICYIHHHPVAASIYQIQIDHYRGFALNA